MLVRRELIGPGRTRRRRRPRLHLNTGTASVTCFGLVFEPGGCTQRRITLQSLLRRQHRRFKLVGLVCRIMPDAVAAAAARLY